jgi:hypothetical protein
MIANVRRVLLTSVALGALCLTTNAFARGGGHGGGGHFEDSGHFGGMHFGKVGVGDVRVGAAAVGHGLGHIRGAPYGQFGTDARLHARLCGQYAVQYPHFRSQNTTTSVSGRNGESATEPGSNGYLGQANGLTALVQLAPSSKANYLLAASSHAPRGHHLGDALSDGLQPW